MAKSVAHKLIESHLVESEMQVGQEIGLKIEQSPTQDATGTMVMLELEAMGLTRVKTELSAQYIDHNITCYRPITGMPMTHLFLGGG
jgi:aconitate hydratase